MTVQPSLSVPATDPREYARKQYRFHIEQAAIHEEFLKAEQTREKYLASLAQENPKVAPSPSPASSLSRPGLVTSENKVPLGQKLKYYEDGILEVLRDSADGTANFKMFWDHFVAKQNQTGISVTKTGLQAAIKRVRANDKIVSISSPFGYQKLKKVDDQG